MQNEKTLQQMIKEHEANMPVEIMNLIRSFDWKKEVRTIVNQNQLMIDIGADLEESIYLLLLGVVNVSDLYERLIEKHQIPQDKVEKIIQEVETQIFNPMYKKMMEMPDVEETKTAPIIAHTPALPKTERDALLAEIEREPEVFVNLNVASIQDTQKIKEEKTPAIEVENTKPFVPSADMSLTVDTDKLAAPSIPKPLDIKANIVPAQGVQDNPVAAGLTTPTATTPSAPIAKSYVADPYREPIE